MYQSAATNISSGGGTTQGTIDISDCPNYKNLTASDIKVAIVKVEGYNVHISNISVNVASYTPSTGIVTFNYVYSTSVSGRSVTISVCAFV